MLTHKAVLTDKERWVEAISLDLETGLDPPGHKVRSAQGLDAASEFIQGYWIWQKVVQNLAAIGYDTNTMDMAAYDWRLAYYNLEIRDNFLSRLKSRIEIMRKTTGKKVVLASHSMGGSLALFFFKWVEAEPDADGFGGGGGPKWVEDHIEAWANIAGTMLGVPKAMTAFLSGEMRDTVELHPLGSYVLEKFFSRRERAQLFRKWPGASSMWMKGGDRIWGSAKGAPDDPEDATDTYGHLFSFRDTNLEAREDGQPDHVPTANLTLTAGAPYLLTHTSPDYQRMFDRNYSIGFETDPKKLKANGRDHRKWSNPLEVELPHAPSMKIYCLYGHGKETERAYWYAKGEYENEDGHADGEGNQAFVSETRQAMRISGIFADIQVRGRRRRVHPHAPRPPPLSRALDRQRGYPQGRQAPSPLWREIRRRRRHDRDAVPRRDVRKGLAGQDSLEPRRHRDRHAGVQAHARGARPPRWPAHC